MSVLKIRNTPSDAWQNIATIKGAKGDKGDTGGNVTDAVKLALLQIAQDVWYLDDKGPAYIQNLHDALYPPTDIVSISAVYTQSGTVYNTDDIDDLKDDLVVTANKTGGTTHTIAAADYTLFGELNIGTSSISVIYRGNVTTFDVNVTREPNGLVDGSYAGTNGLTGTVLNNAVTVGGTTGSYPKITIPLQKSIQVKAGDVLNLTGTPDQIYTDGVAPAIYFDTIASNKWSGFIRWTTASSTITCTADADCVLHSLIFQYTKSETKTITLSLEINGEVIF